MKKLVLKRETLKVLTPSDARQVQGGRGLSDAPGCSVGPGNVCTMGCPPTLPMTRIASCGCPSF